MDLELHGGIVYFRNFEHELVELRQRVNIDRYLIPSIIEEISGW